MRRQIARLFYPYGTERKVLRGPARGMRFTVERGIGVTYAIGSKDAAPRCFSQWVRPGMTVYDVGANKGQMMLLFAALVGRSGRVVSFEPSPAEFESLVRNAKLNRLDDRVSLHRAAAADQDGELCFTYAPTRPTQGKLKNVESTYINSGADEFDVSAVTLDSIAVVERPPDVIKIDVEGAAALVLRGATRVLKDHSPAIYLELHGP